MDDEKRILVFSDAGGTGRSYHADFTAKNQRLRAHYLLEAGWKADTAIQGLGRSNRTNQAQPPLFRPIATDVKAEKRFLSTIARRLDTLGAITKGQRQTGGQGLFRTDDNLESIYARAALRQLYLLLYTGKVEGCSLQAFEDATGLRLTDNDGSLREDLPPITTVLNRLLVDAGLSAPDRRRRTRHRPAGVARLGCADDRERRAELEPGRRVRDRPRRTGHFAASGRIGAASRQRHAEIPYRAHRLHRRHGRTAEGDRSHL